MEPLALSDKEIDQVVAFLFSLTDERLAAENQRQMELQKVQAVKSRPFRDEQMAQRQKFAFEERINR